MLVGFLQQHGKSDEAVAVLDAELQKQPSNMNFVLAKAKLHVARKEADKAMALYGQLEAANPWNGIMERTRAWLALREVDKAEETARRLIALSPEKPQSYLPLAAILEARKDRTGAEEMLVKALSLEPTNPQVGVLLGEFQLRGRDFNKAKQSFEAVLQHAPLNAQALTGKGMALQFSGDKEAAAKAYLQAVQAQHDYVPALNNLSMLWADDEKTRQQALNLAMAAFVRASTDPNVVDTLGYTLVRNNRSEEALKVLERALALAPGNGAILYHQGMALAELGRTAEAVAALEKALGGGEFEERADAEKLMRKLRGQ